MSTIAFVYKWTHLPSGKWYIGSRTKAGCNPDDGYICSSRKIEPMIVENRTDWVRTVVCIGHPDDMLALESRYLTTLDAKHDPMSYNMHNGDGKFTTAGVEPWNKGIKRPTGKPAWNSGLTKENNPSLAKMAEKKIGKPPANKGVPMTEEQRNWLKNFHQNRSPETAAKIGDALRGRTQNPEANAKRSAALKGRVSHRKGKKVGPYKKKGAVAPF